jgi:lysophospholipase L1-like esterase
MNILLRALPLLFVLSTVGLAETKKAAPKKEDTWPKARPTKHDYAKWEKDIAKFEQADRANPPAKGSVLFVGSSTIVRWKTLAADFPELSVLNRGFGGNQIKDSTHYAERMIFPYEPSKILLRAGGNDINSGWSAEDVCNDFKTFVTTVRAKLPAVPIYYISLAPTIKRLKQIPEGDKLNALIAAYCKEQPGLTFIETRSSTVDESGQPVAERFVSDMLHLSPEAYKLMTKSVRQALLLPEAK